MLAGGGGHGGVDSIQVPPGGGAAFAIGAAIEANTVVIGTQAVPEPATLGLISLGLAGVGFAGRKREH